MKNYLLIIMTCICCMVISSCDKKKTSVPPTFKGFTCNPNPAHPGDTMVVRLHYASKGEYVHSPRCSWSLTLDTLSADGIRAQAVLSQKITASIAAEYLSCPFIIPENAVTGRLMTCRVDISFDNSVDTQPGLSIPNIVQPGYMGSLSNSTVKSILYSQVSGSLSIGINAKQ